MQRRAFIQNSGLSLLGFGLSNGVYWPGMSSTFLNEQSITDRIKAKLIDPVIIQSIELLRFDKRLFVQVKDKAGNTGTTQANERMSYTYSLLKDLLRPSYLGKDARNIIQLTDEVGSDDRNYKYTGMPFWNGVGHIEIAVWDLLGKLAQVPVHYFLGQQIRQEVDVYLSSLTRDTSPEKECENLQRRLERTGAKAVKIKVGGRMRNTPEAEKRTQGLIPLMRKKLADDLVVYADANSSYTADEGIRIGKLLEDHKIAIFEEPCYWESYAENRKVNKALKKLKLAGGEQDTSWYRFKDMAEQGVYDILQPDLYYNGGIIRTMRVAQLAAQHGLGIAPHSPKADPMHGAFNQLAAVCPALEGFQEYPATDAIQPGWYTPNIEVKSGKCPILASPGLGINYDASIWDKAELF